MNNASVKDLLLRARAGLKINDLQKEAHLIFYLGLVSENKKQYQKAIKFFKTFYKYARQLEDKVGMCFALNRIAVNYYNISDYEQSLRNHRKALEIMDSENIFTSYYNLGIVLRKLRLIDESLEEFTKAVDWAIEREDRESECLVYGQIALSYYEGKDYKSSLIYFDRCQKLSKMMKNFKLELDCILNVLKIQNEEGNTDKNYIDNYLEAYEVAKSINDQKIAENCKISLALINGEKRFEGY